MDATLKWKGLLLKDLCKARFFFHDEYWMHGICCPGWWWMQIQWWQIRGFWIGTWTWIVQAEEINFIWWHWWAKGPFPVLYCFVVYVLYVIQMVDIVCVNHCVCKPSPTQRDCFSNSNHPLELQAFFIDIGSKVSWASWSPSVKLRFHPINSQSYGIEMDPEFGLTVKDPFTHSFHIPINTPPRFYPSTSNEG